VIPTSAAFKAARRNGTYKLDHLIELYIPTAVQGVTLDSGILQVGLLTATIDGDRTAINADTVILGAYPYPPENFIGNGVARFAVPGPGVPVSLVFNLAGAKVGRVKVYLDGNAFPSDNATSTITLDLATAQYAAGPWTPVTNYKRVEAWEAHNGPSTTGIVGASVTVTSVDTNRKSACGLIDFVLPASLSGATANYWRLRVTTATNQNVALCEVEFYRREDVTSRLISYEISHGVDVKLASVTARTCTAVIANEDLLFYNVDFQRPLFGQPAIDSCAELHIFCGIEGEFIRLGSFAIDQAGFDHATRQISLSCRGATERTMFDRDVYTWRNNTPLGYPTTIPGFELDDAARLVWDLCNNPSALTVIERSPTLIPVIATDGRGRTELETMRLASHDRGVYVDHDGILRSLAGSTESPLIGNVITATASTAGDPTATNRVPGINFGLSISLSLLGDGLLPMDSIFWADKLIRGTNICFLEQTFANTSAAPAVPELYTIGDTDVDGLVAWLDRAPFGTRTTLVNIFGKAFTSYGAPAAKVFSVPNIMAKRPNTNDYYFLTGARYNGNRMTVNAGAHPPLLISGYTVTTGGGAGVIPGAYNLVMPGYALAATFIGTTLYWSSYLPGTFTGRLYKWDVTTPFAATLLGTETSNIRSLANVGGILYWGREDGSLVSWNPASAFATRTIVGKPFPGAGANTPIPWRLVADGTVLWGGGLDVGTGSATNPALVFCWDTAQSFATLARPSFKRTISPGGALTVSGGKAVYVDNTPVDYSCGSWEVWDGFNGSTPVIFAYGTRSSTNRTGGYWANTQGRGPFPICGIGKGPGWYGRIPMFGWRSRSDRQTWIMYLDPTANPVDTLTERQIASLSENVSYELGGSAAIVNGVDVGIHNPVSQANQVLWEETPGTASNESHFIKLPATANPTGYGPSGSLVVDRNGTRILKVRGGFGGLPPPVLQGSTLRDSSILFRILGVDKPTDDPNKLNTITLDVKYIVDGGQGFTLANRIMLETKLGTRWMQTDSTFFPDLEVADILQITLAILSGSKPFSVQGMFRVVHVAHRVSIAGEGGGAEAMTSLEIVGTTSPIIPAPGVPIPPVVAGYRGTIMADNPIAYWRWAGAGPTNPDETGHGHTATDVNTITHNVTGLISGDPDKAVTTTGTGWFSVPDDPAWDVTSYSIETWIATAQATGVILSQEPGGAPTEFIEVRLQLGQLCWADAIAGVGFGLTSFGPVVNDGLAHHLAVVKDAPGQTAKWYVDGAYVGGLSGAVVTNAQHAIAEIVSIGALGHTGGGAGGHENGTYDETAFYGYALTPTQILRHYQVGIGLP